MGRAGVVIGLGVAAVVVTTPEERLGRALYDAGAPWLAGVFLDGDLWDGATLYARGRFAEAAEAFEKAPTAEADYDRGTALAKAGKLGEAVFALERALDRDPNDEDARYNLALVEALKAKRERVAPDAPGAANASATEQRRGGEAPSSAESDVNSTGEGAAGDRDSGREAQSPGRAQVSKASRAAGRHIDESGGEARGSIGASEGAGRTGREGAKVARPFEELLKLPKKSFSQQVVQPSPQWLETISDDPGRFLRLKLAAERAGRAQRGLAAPAETDPW